MILTDLCQEVNNWFVSGQYFGTFEVDEHGVLKFADSGDTFDGYLLNGQYFRIVNSVFNDGVHQFPAEGLKPEVFDGAVWAMRVPPAFIALAADIETWQDKYADVVNSPYSSESFGGYSYTKGAGNNDGGAVTWQDSFADRLNRWRKLK